MKKSIFLFVVLLLSAALFAQVEIDHSAKGLSFQGIARDAQGNAITESPVTVEFTIGSWSETVDIPVDQFGVFSHIIGDGDAGFAELDFSQYDYNFTVTVNSNEIYNGKLNSVPYAKAAGNGVPVGSVMPFAGTVSSGASLQEVVPGWLVCNGASLTSDAKYEKLKDVLGSSWGAAGKLPDLRGVFLRGINNGRTGTYSDPDTRDVGDYQDDTFKSHDHPAGELVNSNNGNHTHKLIELDNGSDVTDGADGDITVDNSGRDDNIHRDGRVQAAGDHTHTISGTTGNRGGDETRPVNAGVNFIIKY